jgi:hypothetical protein
MQKVATTAARGLRSLAVSAHGHPARLGVAVGRKFDMVEWAHGPCAHSTMSNFRPTTPAPRKTCHVCIVGEREFPAHSCLSNMHALLCQGPRVSSAFDQRDRVCGNGVAAYRTFVQSKPHSAGVQGPCRWGGGSSAIRSLTWPTTKNFNIPKVYRGKRRHSIPSTQLMRWVVGARLNLTWSNDHHAQESIRPCQTPAPRAPLGGPLPFFAPSEHTIEFGKYATLINSKLRRSRWGSSIDISLPNTCTAL